MATAVAVWSGYGGIAVAKDWRSGATAAQHKSADPMAAGSPRSFTAAAKGENILMFSDKEIEYLNGQRLGRLASVTANNRAHVVPTGFRVSDDGTAIEVGGHNLSARRPLYLRNIETNPWVAYVVDDVASTNPWTPRGVTVRGRAEIRTEGGERLGPGFDSTLIVITPTHITSWGIDGAPFGPPHSRKVD